MAFLRQPARDVTVDWHPHIQFVVEAFDAPPEVRSPELVFTGDITQGFEGNGDLDRPAIGSQSPFRFHHYVRIKVLTQSVGPNPIRLYT